MSPDRAGQVLYGSITMGVRARAWARRGGLGRWIATIGIVVSGGGARGAYEFGALEVLAPVLDEPAQIVVGASAGGLGAADLAADAHRRARGGRTRWRGGVARVEIGGRHRPAVSPRELARVLLYGLELLGIGVPGPPSLLDTSPQPKTVAALIDFEQLARNVEDGTLAAVAVVATAYATARSVVFHHGGESPASDNQRGIDYVATRLAVEHVQASSAIQSLFPAVRVEERWYGDGRRATQHAAETRPQAQRRSASGDRTELDRRAAAGLQRSSPGRVRRRLRHAQAVLADQLAHDVDTLATITTT